MHWCLFGCPQLPEAGLGFLKTLEFPAFQSQLWQVNQNSWTLYHQSLVRRPALLHGLTQTLGRFKTPNFLTDSKYTILQRLKLLKTGVWKQKMSPLKFFLPLFQYLSSVHYICKHEIHWSSLPLATQVRYPMLSPTHYIYNASSKEISCPSLYSHSIRH